MTLEEFDSSACFVAPFQDNTNTQCPGKYIFSLAGLNGLINVTGPHVHYMVLHGNLEKILICSWIVSLLLILNHLLIGLDF